MLQVVSPTFSNCIDNAANYIHYKSKSNQRFVPTLIDSSAGQQRMTTLLAFCSSWSWCVGSSQMTYISQVFSLTSAFFHQRRKKSRNLTQLLSLDLHYLSVTSTAADNTFSDSHMKQNCHSQLRRRHDRASPDGQPKSLHCTDT